MRSNLITRLAVCLILLVLAATANAQSNWEHLDTGLELGSFSFSGMSIDDIPVTVLRISPRHYRFQLLTSTSHGKGARTPEEWAEEFNLTALINASMYLPDNKTSTGYMRHDDHVNNSRINQRFGSFFVANPKGESASSGGDSALTNPPHDIPATGELPQATLLDKQHDDWEEGISLYDTVVQNFRMISAQGTNLWPREGRAFSIAAIASDTHGNILFIHCHTPVTVHTLAEALLDFPLDIHKAMYVEGGPQATLLINTPALSRTWSGRHVGDFWSGAATQWPLPNVIGISRR